VSGGGVNARLRALVDGFTGRTLVGYCEVEMAALDGQKHWYPIDQMRAENGDTLKEEELPIPVDEGPDDSGEEESEE